MTSQVDHTVSAEDEPNNPNLKWIFLGVTALVFGVLAGWLLINYLQEPYVYHGTVIQSPNRANNFTLTGQDGNPVSLNDFRGQAVMIYFGYTFCPDVCPATMVELAKANDALGDESDIVQVIMVTIDPERDSPQLVQEYVNHFDPSFIGLSGSAEEIAAAATPFGIYYEKHEGSEATGYLMSHTSSVVVVDPEGYIRLLYPFNMPGENMAEDILHMVN